MLQRTYHVLRASGIELLAAEYRGHRFAPHSHDYGVVAVTESGEAAFESGGRTGMLRRGSVLMIPPEVIHAAQSVGSTPWRYRALYVSADWFGGATGPARAIVARAPVLAKRLHELHVAVMDRSGDAQVCADLESLRRDLAPLTDKALDAAVRGPSSAMDSGANARDDSVAHRARSLIDAAPRERWSLARLARECDASPGYLCRTFARRVGATPYAYALQRRIAASRALIAAGGTIGRVAHELGFADQSHFTRLFLRVFGLTPGEYRAALPAA